MSDFTPEGICNLALREIGWLRPISDIYEGSRASRIALEIYGQTRDEALQSKAWPFSLREVFLSPTPNAPPSPWVAEYFYPGDCLRIRYVRPGPLAGGQRSLDPQPVLFMPWNDNRTNPTFRAILCDIPMAIDGIGGAVLSYTGRITDPATWEPEFIKTLVADLVPKFAAQLSDPAAAQTIAAMATNEAREAPMVTDLLAPSIARQSMPETSRR